MSWLLEKQNSSYCSFYKSTLNESKLPCIYSTRQKNLIILEVDLVYL
jgi:hypothetical protein